VRARSGQHWRQAQEFADDSESESAVVDPNCGRAEQMVVAVIDLFARARFSRTSV
jgi:hypothetical protein